MKKELTNQLKKLQDEVDNLRDKINILPDDENITRFPLREDVVIASVYSGATCGYKGPFGICLGERILFLSVVDPENGYVVTKKMGPRIKGHLRKVDRSKIKAGDIYVGFAGDKGHAPTSAGPWDYRVALKDGGDRHAKWTFGGGLANNNFSVHHYYKFFRDE